jgi:hypothetical protein
MTRRPDANTLETLDHATGRPLPTPRRIDLSSLRDVRLELAHVYRQIDSGEIPSQEGTRRAYVLKTIAEIIEVADLERRVAQLEARRAHNAAVFPVKVPAAVTT